MKAGLQNWHCTNRKIRNTMNTEYRRQRKGMVIEMIFYFTGTGNSLYVAKELDEDIISIPQVIKEERPEFTADSIGIVCPVYGHEIYPPGFL